MTRIQKRRYITEQRVCTSIYFTVSFMDTAHAEQPCMEWSHRVLTSSKRDRSDDPVDKALFQFISETMDLSEM